MRKTREKTGDEETGEYVGFYEESKKKHVVQ
jgi:hypothetical protein